MSELAAIDAWISAAARRARAAVALESLALGAASALVVAAAAVVSGASALDVATWCAAALGAGACATTWFMERRRTREEIARRADRALEQRGALVTALESRSSSSSFARSLAQRVASSLAPSALARAVPWPSPLFAAAPLIAAVALALAFEREPRLSEADAALLGRVAVGVSVASQSDDPASSAAVERVLASAGVLAHASQTRLADRDEIARELARVDQALSELARNASAAKPELRAARDLTAAALERFTGAGQRADGERGGATAETSASDAGASAVANGSAPRTMSGPAHPAQSPMNASQPAAAPSTAPNAEAGTVAGRWWSPRYDAIVAAFLESAPAQR